MGGGCTGLRIELEISNQWKLAPIVGISGSIISKRQMNWHIFNEGLESRDQLQQEVAALLQQQAAIAERLNAIGAIPPESTEQETPVARTRDMGKEAEPWEAHEDIHPCCTAGTVLRR